MEQLMEQRDSPDKMASLETIDTSYETDTVVETRLKRVKIVQRFFCLLNERGIALVDI